MRYALQNKDTVLIEFDLKSESVEIEGIVSRKVSCDIQKIHSELSNIFPKTEAEKQAEVREEKRKLITWLNGIKRLASQKKKNTGSGQDGKP